MRLSLFLVLALLSFSFAPSRAEACNGLSCHSSEVDVNVNVNVGIGVGGGECGGGYCGGFHHRPICPIGDVGPGCRAPLRKFGRGIARAGFRAVRGVGRFLFGRRCRC